MKLFSNKLFLGGLIGCLILIVGIYLFTQSKTENSVTYGTPENTLTLHLSGEDSSLSDTDPWEVWIERQLDVWMEVTESSFKENGFTDKERILMKNLIRDKMIANLEGIKKKHNTPPPLDRSPIAVTKTTKWNTTGPKHTGPQTIEALMESFHATYLSKRGSHRILDIEYPPEQWLHSLLDKGITINNYVEYAQYMNGRGKEKVLYDENSWIPVSESKRLGIPLSEMEKLKAAFIDDWIERKRRSNEAKRTDENISGGFHLGETFLPSYIDREITYVKRSGTGAMFIGTSLTDEQKFNIVFRGIEPHEIDIVYIGESGSIVKTHPLPIAREEFRKMIAEGETPPPEEWWDSNAPIPDLEDFKEFLPPDRTGAELDSQKRRAREEFERSREEFERHAKEVARQPEFEQFMQDVRQLEKFATMSDVEIAAELEKQLRQQLLPGLSTEANLEDALREKITPKPLTTERFNKAKQILQNHGPKEGLRRLTQADPELAEYFRRNPQKVPPPKRSQPSNADDSQKE